MNPLIIGAAGIGLVSLVGSAAAYSPMSYPVNKNLRAFLAMLRKFESNNRYDAYVYGGSFSDMSDHPIATGEKEYVYRKDGRPTSAAGAYQFVYSTWQDMGGAAKYGDFSISAQDKLAVDYIKARGALEYINAGLFWDAKEVLAPVWESLKTNSDAALSAFYQSNGGVMA
jgi:muramidase (phage lysozyme)